MEANPKLFCSFASGIQRPTPSLRAVFYRPKTAMVTARNALYSAIQPNLLRPIITVTSRPARVADYPAHRHSAAST
jgi:hypothetical protein